MAKITKLSGWSVVVALLLFPFGTTMADSISQFKKVAETKNGLIVAVRYRYSSKNGDDIWMGAEALMANGARAANIGYRPWKLHAGSDWAYVYLSLVRNRTVSTKKIRLKMYIGGEKKFYDRTFNLNKTWRYQKNRFQPWTFRQKKANAKNYTFSIKYDLYSGGLKNVRAGGVALYNGSRSNKHGFGPSKKLKRGKNKSATTRVSYIKSGTAKSQAIMVIMYEGGKKAFMMDLIPKVKYWAKKTKDSDGDGISDANERVLRTNPRSKDTDKDGLNDGWELEGYHWKGYLYIDSNLPLLGANPRRKDVFVEVDYLKGKDHHHKMFPDAVHKAKWLYGNLNISNPNGRRGISLHIFNNNAINYDGSIGGVCGARKYLAYFPKRKNRIYHWAIAGHGTGGQATIGSNRFVFGTGDGTPKSGSIKAFDKFMAYAVFSHELGHNLGIYHSGKSSGQSNCKANYPSLMNYSYDYSYINSAGTGCSGFTLSSTRIRFSRGGSPTLNEKKLREKGAWPSSRTYLKCYDGDFNGYNTFKVSGTNVDWNRNGTYQSGTVKVDIFSPSCGTSGDGLKSNQKDYNDAAIIRATIVKSIKSPGRVNCSSSGPSSGFHARDSRRLQPVCGIQKYRGLKNHPLLKVNPVFLIKAGKSIRHPVLRKHLKPVLQKNFRIKKNISKLIRAAQVKSRVRVKIPKLIPVKLPKMRGEK